MASHAFDKRQVVPDTGKRHALTLVPPLFTRAGDQVIELARKDSMASIRPGSWLTNIGRRLFGIEPANPLADPRLEAIRRFAVAVRHGHRGTIDVEHRQFLAAGFSPGHADHIIWRMTEKLPLPMTKG